MTAAAPRRSPRVRCDNDIRGSRRDGALRRSGAGRHKQPLCTDVVEPLKTHIAHPIRPNTTIPHPNAPDRGQFHSWTESTIVAKVDWWATRLAGSNRRLQDVRMDAPETRYAKAADGISIAYHVVGDGQIDLIWLHAFMGKPRGHLGTRGHAVAHDQAGFLRKGDQTRHAGDGPFRPSDGTP